MMIKYTLYIMKNFDKKNDADFICSRKGLQQRSISTPGNRRPRWHSWMRRLTGDQEVAGSAPAEVGNILSRIVIMKYFLQSCSPFR